MQYFSNEISTGYAVNAAFMSYVENETVTDILQNTLDWKSFQEEYSKGYMAIEKYLGNLSRRLILFSTILEQCMTLKANYFTE